ncbi:MAG: hypothetical protein OXT63_04040 [Gemmatimonadota bacterium]|nr:hypothetical protein [Gemmatimonadota bacterium]
MIDILADSPDDEALIAEAVGGDARVVSGSLPFANGDGHVGCRILGCRQPIPPARIELLRKMERNTPSVPVILVTDRAVEVARQLSGVKVAAIVWFASLRYELKPAITAARQSVPLLRLAEQAEEAELPPALRSGLAYSYRAASHRPVRNVKELATAVYCSPTTLSREFRERAGGAANLTQFLHALSVVKAHQLRLSGLSWDAVANRLELSRQTLHSRSARWPGGTLKQLARVRQAPLMKKFFADFARPLLSPSQPPLLTPSNADGLSLLDRVYRFQASLARQNPPDSERVGDTAVS